MKKSLQAIGFPLLGLFLAIVLCSALLPLLGESPFVLLQAMQTSLFTQFGLGYTLVYATPLLFTGLSVAISFHCGLFNIGAEGQLYVGALAIVLVSALFPHAPLWIGVPLGFFAALLAGGFWGGIAGLLKARRGSHEVIVTILLNFIALALCNYLIIYPLADPEIQAPETIEIASGYFIPTFNKISVAFGGDLFHGCPVNVSLFVGLFLAFALQFLLFRTPLGFELRAVGQNPIASRFAGIRVKRKILMALAMSGAIAGLVGTNEVMGYHHSVIEGFSPSYGFTGIAVALLARNSPIGIIFSALLFGLLHNSAREIEFLSEKITKDLSSILQGVLIAFVAADYLLKQWFTKRRRT